MTEDTKDIGDEFLEEVGGLEEPAEDTGEEEGSTPEPEEQEEAEEEKPEAEEPEEGEKPEAEEKPKSPAPDESDDWTYAMGKAERKKRQEAEARIAELERQLSESKEDKERPDVFQDPDGAFDHLAKSEAEKRWQERVSLSRDMMTMLKDDYEQREAEFAELAKDNPELIAEMQRHPNPARYAYEKAVKHARLKEMENVEEWEAKKEAEIRARLEAELAEKAKQDKAKDDKKRDAVTPSLASQKSSETKRETVDGILDEVFPHWGA